MRRVLALETSGDIGSIALLLGESVAERRIATPREQTETVLPYVDSLLNEAGIRLQDLDAVAFGRGPGSFTGLRVATAVAQGFAIALALPLVPISSLAAIAQGVWRCHGIAASLVCIDARMGEVFWARYAVRDGVAAVIGTEHLGAPTDVESGERGTVWAAVGNGFASYPTELATVTSGATSVLPEQGPLARDLLPLALSELDRGTAATLETALPVYLRREEAWRR